MFFLKSVIFLFDYYKDYVLPTDSSAIVLNQHFRLYSTLSEIMTLSEMTGDFCVVF